jgi:hypothetical protein
MKEAYMRLSLRSLSFSIIFLLALYVVGHATPAHAQALYCASDDGKRNFCSMNTRGGVQMTKQRSGSACIQGQTWGWDNRSVWVDRGCRAEFISGNGNGFGGGNGNGNGWGNGSGSGQTLYCASDNGKRNFCAANTRGGVQMTRQRSGSACIQGQTWGWDNRSVWVDRGCRADFITGSGNGNGNGWGNGSGSGQTLYCASDDGKRNFCSMNTRGGVQMTKQRSGSACIQGQTWGWDNRGVWVDRGCRADFISR